MKKVLSILFAVIFTAMILTAVPAGAAVYIPYGDWLLETGDGSTYLVGGYTGNETIITLPTDYNGQEIVGVSDKFYSQCGSELYCVTIPEGFVSIGSYAFQGMSSLESVIFPSTLSSIGLMAFSGCSSLETVDLSDAKSLTEIPYACFSNCSSLESVNLPEKTDSIASYAFSKTGLESISLPKSVKTLGSYCFADCESLLSAELNTALNEIGDYAFYNDTLLTSVYLPKALTKIGAHTFRPMAISGGSLTLECLSDTYAASYAATYFFNHTNETRLTGDFNGNGKVTIRDATYIQLYCAHLISLPDSAAVFDSVDVNCDGAITIRDATMIQMKLVGLIDF